MRLTIGPPGRCKKRAVCSYKSPVLFEFPVLAKILLEISFQQSYLMTIGKRVIYVKTALIDYKRFNV